MRVCSYCKKKFYSGDGGKMFSVPKDPIKRARWNEICGRWFTPSSVLCIDHFLPTSIATTGSRLYLMRNAEPHVSDIEKKEISVNTSTTKENTDRATPKITSQNNVFGNQKEEFKQNSSPNSNIVIPPQLQEEPIMHVPQEESMMQITVIKSVSCAQTTQTNTRLCGLVETSDLADEFRFSCFYCSEVFLLEKWKIFVNHLKNKHFEMEEAFKTSKYISEDHDYTPINLTPSIPTETSLETVVYNAKSFLVDPLEPTHNPIGSMDLNSFYCTQDDNKATSNTKQALPNFTKTNKSLSTMPVSLRRNRFSRRKGKRKYSFLRNSQAVAASKHKIFKSKLMPSERFHLGDSIQQLSKVTPLSRCLKRTNEIEEEMRRVDVMEEYEINPVSNVNQNPTEITFGYTPRDIVNTLLDNMKNYPVLWQFDDEPFNQDYYEAVEDLCKIVNYKWSLNIDNLKMRRSINRILRYYCYLYPNTNVENVDQFTSYYDKCDTFLPSAHEVAYARCSHCYTCFKSDFELKIHLGVEHSYLQWPYKCPQCKECFRESDDFEFHKHLPHYDEVFRCPPCNKSFFRLHSYKRHILETHANSSSGEYKCDLCDHVVQTMSGLRNHKKTHGEKQYNCNQCSKSFFENSKLTLHLKTHKKQYDFICEICGKGFVIQSGLRTHMKKHTGEKVTCNICNLKLRKSSLSRHMRTVHVVHEGIVETTVKGKHLYYRRLIKPGPLRRGQRKSVEKRHYRCKICKIGFDSYKLIVEHNKELHFDGTKWPCKICSAQFNQKLNLKVHYRKKHKLHVYQVFKLVEENLDLDEVLAIKTEHIDKLFGSLTCSKNNPDNVEKSNVTTTIKSDALLDDTYFEEEDELYGSTMEDELMEGVDNIDVKDNIIEDIFSDF